MQRNALAGHEFDDWNALHTHLTWWMDEVADRRVHGTTGDVPLERFEREEADALAPFEWGRAFGALLEQERLVNAEACVMLDTNAYSVPWKLMFTRVQVRVSTHTMKVFSQGECVAEHELLEGRHQRRIHLAHLEGMGQRVSWPHPLEERGTTRTGTSSLMRPLSEYAAVIAQEAL